MKFKELIDLIKYKLNKYILSFRQILDYVDP